MPDPPLPRVVVLHADAATAETFVDWLAPGYAVEAVDPDVPSDGTDPDESVVPEDADVVVLDWGVDAAVRDPIIGSDATAVLVVAEGVPSMDPIEAGAAEYVLAPVGEGDLRAAVERVYLQRAYREWLTEYLDATEDVDPAEMFPPDLPADLETTQEAMDSTLAELIEEVPYSTLFRTLLDREPDPRLDDGDDS